MDIKDLNPWWKTGKIKEEYSSLPQRSLFKEIADYIEEKQIIAIHGLRRTGKTVLMHHIIGFLLKTNPQEKIIYYSFDLLKKKIEDILDESAKFLGIDLQKEKVYVFLDEIQKLEGWENELKLLYDNYRNVKFFISGSSSLFIEKKTKESLGGRAFSFVLNPLTFPEYLELKGVKTENILLFEKEIKEDLAHYIRTGGFPELIRIQESEKIDKYIKELVIDRVIYIDIPSAFQIEEPQLLERILKIISSNPGMIADYESLADDLSRNRKTISNYIFYLEKAFLIKKLYNYSSNLLTTEKKSKRLYPSSTSFAFLFNAQEGRIIEAAILMNSNFRFFSRAGNKEVDFIGSGKTTLPIEAKYSDSIKEKQLKGLLKFMGDYNLDEGIVITKDLEDKRTIKGGTVSFIPLWKWLLSMHAGKS